MAIFNFIYSSKDTTIRVWDRKTLTLQHTLTGHEGPVNAIGLQGDRLASASGEGKMMLWDITAGTRLHTFEGTDRGLACIDFKVRRYTLSRYKAVKNKLILPYFLCIG